MKSKNKTEVLLFSKYSINDLSHRELVTWLGTTLQPVIKHQQRSTQKFSLKTLRETPAIYLS